MMLGLEYMIPVINKIFHALIRKLIIQGEDGN